jgi:hypothetical protein
MNDVTATNASATAVATATTVDDSNPWLGLASFTEETRGFFYGRDEEVAELARRVQRKLLTVLFGQSGLGKTSILRAGIVPRLRAQGYCPIYVRIDYGKDTPEPAEQIKQAIMQAARRSGEWTQVGVAAAGESLWEFLHHRDDVLRDEAGGTLIPLLIFDQFEEIFTLAQGDDFGRARAARFVAELADLVENRPPKELEAKFEEDDTSAERFDFARSDYRVLIALREDYLAALEGLKKAMPSISQNRLRLARMTGTQALTAVTQPGKKLVTEEVAAAIVRFVAGGSELANAEVEPSLLSLICRELNDARIAKGSDEISLDLLAGSHASILSSFYERALADQPVAVRRIIEDELLTASGFRENVAEERLVSHFTAAGAAPDTLAVLVNRRLLRIEERLDTRRAELTHDVLCAVVKGSRDQRQEREAREATERLLAQQREREGAARRAMVRARQVAAACTVLALVAIVAAGFAYVSGKRAQRAERVAQETRGEAEHLLGYLTDDFGRELESFGRLDVLAEFSQRQIDYFHALAPALRGPETIRNGALALESHARAMRTLGHLDVAGANAAEAVQLLEGLRATRDNSEATLIALALGYSIQGKILDSRNDPGALKAHQRAVELLRPAAEAHNASVSVRRAYVTALVSQGFQQWANDKKQEAVVTETLAQRVAADLGARDLTDLHMGAYYAEAGGWMTEALFNLGHNMEARRVGADAVAVAEKVLERRPGYRLALHAQQLIESNFGQLAGDELNPAAAVRASQRAVSVSATILKLDPDNTTSINNLAVAELDSGLYLWSAAHLREAVLSFQRATDDFGRASAGGATMAISHAFVMGRTAILQDLLGDSAGAAATLAAGAPFLAKLRKTEPPGSLAVVIGEWAAKLPTGFAALERDDLAAAQRVAGDAVSRIQAAAIHGDAEAQFKAICVAVSSHLAGRIEYRLGNFAAAEKAEREALQARRKWGEHTVADQRELGDMSMWLAMAQARQGRISEAAHTIAAVVKLQRELAARNHGDQWVPLELARALYVESLTDPTKKAATLQEAAKLIDGLAPTLQPLHDTRLWREWIRGAQHGAAARTAAGAAGKAAGKAAG